MVGAQFAVSTVCPDFAQRFVQPIDAALIIVFFGIANLPLNVLFFFLTEGVGVAAGTRAKRLIAKAMRYFILEPSIVIRPRRLGSMLQNNKTLGHKPSLLIIGAKR
jgi:hypothetical protein